MLVQLPLSVPNSRRILDTTLLTFACAQGWEERALNLSIFSSLAVTTAMPYRSTKNATKLHLRLATSLDTGDRHNTKSHWDPATSQPLQNP